MVEQLGLALPVYRALLLKVDAGLRLCTSDMAPTVASKAVPATHLARRILLKLGEMCVQGPHQEVCVRLGVRIFVLVGIVDESLLAY